MMMASLILMITPKMAIKSPSLRRSLSPKMNLGSKWNMVVLYSSKKETKIAEVVGVAKEMEDDGTLGNRAAA